MGSACGLYIYIPSAGVGSRILCTNTLQRTATMASSTPDAASFEEVCRDIHDACGQPRLLGLLLAPRSPSERQQIRATYRATFGKDLAGTVQRVVATNLENEVGKEHCGCFGILIPIVSAFTVDKVIVRIVSALQAALPMDARTGRSRRGHGAGGRRGRHDCGRLPDPGRGLHAAEAEPALLHQAGVHGQVQEEPRAGHGRRAVSSLPEGT
jgi:hypothetical protein